MGVERILRGVLHYRQTTQKLFQYELKDVKLHPNPSAVFISCMDARLFPNDFTLTKAGDMYVMRNAGNMIPKFEQYGSIQAGVKLGCINSNIKDIVVCGHSDCKAMYLLWSMRDDIYVEQDDPLREWVRAKGRLSLMKYLHEYSPLEFTSPLPLQSFTAIIDEDGRYGPEDQLSQVHCLQQLVNLSAFHFLKEKLKNDEVRLNAMWFDVDSADVYMFSRMDQKFILVTEENVPRLLPAVLNPPNLLN